MLGFPIRESGCPKLQGFNRSGIQWHRAPGTLGTKRVKSGVIAGGLKWHFTRDFTAPKGISSESVKSQVRVLPLLPDSLSITVT